MLLSSAPASGNGINELLLTDAICGIAHGKRAMTAARRLRRITSHGTLMSLVKIFFCKEHMIYFLAR